MFACMMIEWSYVLQITELWMSIFYEYFKNSLAMFALLAN